MSEMLPSEMLSGDEEPAQTPWISRWVDIEPAQSPIGSRWVDIVQVASPPVIERESESMATPHNAVMVIIALTLMLAIFEILVIGMRLAGSTPRRY